MSDKNGKVDFKIKKTLQLVAKVLASYLAIKVGNYKFTGKIDIEVNCRDGGIGNVSIDVNQNFSEKSIDNLDK